jgi:hypothetical protein
VTIGTFHPQVTLKYGRMSASVDEKLAPLIRELWRANIRTLQSCQNHTATKKVWLHFPTAENAERFLNVAIERAATPDLWRRASSWYFGQHNPIAGPLYAENGEPIALKDSWEFHTGIGTHSADGRSLLIVEVSVLFPRRDLKTVLARMQAFNAAQRAASSQRASTAPTHAMPP